MSDILGSGEGRVLASNLGSSTHFEDILACVVAALCLSLLICKTDITPWLGKARRAGASKNFLPCFLLGLVLLGGWPITCPGYRPRPASLAYFPAAQGRLIGRHLSNISNSLPLSLSSQWLTQLTQEKFVSLPLSSALHFFVTFLDQKRRKKKKGKKINM